MGTTKDPKNDHFNMEGEPLCTVTNVQWLEQLLGKLEEPIPALFIVSSSPQVRWKEKTNSLPF